MNRDEMPRIRLKVATTAGINILCTALRKWRVAEWLPHIEQAFREVKEDQGEDQDSRKTFIKALRLKKGQFYIANSEVIGDVFQDNDEVQCEMDFPGRSKRQIKEHKKNKKNQHTPQPEHLEHKVKKNQDAKSNKQDEKRTREHLPSSEPSKKVKGQDTHNLVLQADLHQQDMLAQDYEKDSAKDEWPIHPNQQLQAKRTISKKAKSAKAAGKAAQTKNEKLVKIDLSKLKSLLIKNEKKPQPFSKVQPPQSKNSEDSNAQVQNSS